MVTISVAVMITDFNCRSLLLVKNRVEQKWGLPAGGLQWLEHKKRLETPEEAVNRELTEETGLKETNLNHRLTREAVINLTAPGEPRGKIGHIYDGTTDLGITDGHGQLMASPEDITEIEEAKFFEEEELIALLKKKEIRKPDFNRGIIIWWIRNRHRDRWDPYRGAEPIDGHHELDEVLLAKLNKLTSKNLYKDL